MPSPSFKTSGHLVTWRWVPTMFCSFTVVPWSEDHKLKSLIPISHVNDARRKNCVCHSLFVSLTANILIIVFLLWSCCVMKQQVCASVLSSTRRWAQNFSTTGDTSNFFFWMNERKITLDWFYQTCLSSGVSTDRKLRRAWDQQHLQVWSHLPEIWTGIYNLRLTMFLEQLEKIKSL